MAPDGAQRGLAKPRGREARRRPLYRRSVRLTWHSDAPLAPKALRIR